jgi:hypothetical protein
MYYHSWKTSKKGKQPFELKWILFRLIHPVFCECAQQSVLRDTVGKRAKRDKMRGGGWHVSKNSITLADARRNRTDREDAVGGE